MKNIINIFVEQNIIFQSFLSLDIKLYSKTSRLKVFKAIDLKNNYCLIIVNERKSRFLKKDIENLENIFSFFKKNLSHNFAKKYLLLTNAPLCSKAKIQLDDLKWITI